MLYRKFNPCRELEPLVECYYVWETYDDDPRKIFESPPNGFCSIVFNSGTPYYLGNSKYERLRVPDQFIAGQAIYSYKLYVPAPVMIAGIVFKPAALNTLYGIPVYEYTEERVPLSKVFRHAFLDPFIRNIAKGTAEDKARLLEHFVLEEYNIRKPSIDAIDIAANKIIETNGMLNITELLNTIYMSRRTFERNFFRKVGLSPKYYARIRRIGYLANLIAGKKAVDWNEMFTQAAFYDHSHLIRDFLEFTGRTPQQYLEENLELANFIRKPSSENL
ncbi:DUF6597 domain-containing transcriptional factor [Flavitalea sp.]|nr:helix-turn-helix domain-containing protein [Flavitalea sp.]